MITELFELFFCKQAVNNFLHDRTCHQPVLIGDRKHFRLNDSGVIFGAGQMHFEIAELNPEIRQWIINGAVGSTEIGSSNRKIACVVHIVGLAPGIYLYLF